MQIGTHKQAINIGGGTVDLFICELCDASGTREDLFKLSCAAVSAEPERTLRQAEGVRTWFTPDGAISEMIFTDEEDHPRLTTDLIDAVIETINPADIETAALNAGAAMGYDGMVKHTLNAIRVRLHDQVHARTAQAPKDGG